MYSIGRFQSRSSWTGNEKGVGKTSLLQRYTQGKYEPKLTTSTTGAFFVTKKAHVQGLKVRLQLWDTAGQERFRSMVRVFSSLVFIQPVPVPVSCPSLSPSIVLCDFWWLRSAVVPLCLLFAVDIRAADEQRESSLVIASFTSSSRFLYCAPLGMCRHQCIIGERTLHSYYTTSPTRGPLTTSRAGWKVRSP